MRRQLLLGGALALLVVLPLSIKALRVSEQKAVEVVTVEKRAITPSILASGILAFGSQVTLVSEVLARVDEVLVTEGSSVRRGQVLLRLESESLHAEIAQLTAARRQAELAVDRQRIRLEAAVSKLKRNEELHRHGMVDSLRFDDLASEVHLAEVELRNSQEAVRQSSALLAQAQLRLTKTEVRAPIDGIVTAVSIKRGETAVPSAMSIAGGSLMVVADTRQLYAEIQVDESDIARVTADHAATIVPVAFPDRLLKGRVETIALTPRQTPGQSRTYPVRIRLDPVLDLKFHPGMSARADIATAATAQRLSVPLQAIQYEGPSGASKANVFVVENSTVRKRAIEAGISDDTYQEVVKGLNADDVVVVGPAKTLRFLREGERVQTRPGALKTAALGQPPTAEASR